MRANCEEMKKDFMKLSNWATKYQIKINANEVMQKQS